MPWRTPPSATPTLPTSPCIRWTCNMTHHKPKCACSCLRAQSLGIACCAMDLLCVPLVMRGPRVSLPGQCSGTLHAVKGLPWRAEKILCLRRYLVHMCRLLRRALLGVHCLHRCVWIPAKQKETQSSCPARTGRPPAIRCCPRIHPARPSSLAKRSACLTASRRRLPSHSLPVQWPRERMKLEVDAP